MKILFYICEELHNSETQFIPLNIILIISSAILPVWNSDYPQVFLQKIVPSTPLLFTLRDNSAHCAIWAIAWLSAGCHFVLPMDPSIRNGTKPYAVLHTSHRLARKVMKINHANIMRYPSCDCWWVSGCVSSLSCKRGETVKMSACFCQCSLSVLLCCRVRKAEASR